MCYKRIGEIICKECHRVLQEVPTPVVQCAGWKDYRVCQLGQGRGPDHPERRRVVAGRRLCNDCKKKRDDDRRRKHQEKKRGQEQRRDVRAAWGV